MLQLKRNSTDPLRSSLVCYNLLFSIPNVPFFMPLVEKFILNANFTFSIFLFPPVSVSLSPGSSSQNGSALRRELSGGSYSSKRHTMTSPSESSLSSGGGGECGDAPLSQFDREVSEKRTTFPGKSE